MTNPIRFLLAAVTITALSFATPAAESKIPVLILDGFSNHDWRQTTAQIRGVLAPTGLFDVSVSTAPNTTNVEAFGRWRPNFSDYQVVIQTCNDIGGGPSWPEPVKKDFADFVRGGGGVYIFHSAENAFVGWKEYEAIVGLCWRKKDFGTAIRVREDGQLLRIPPGQGRGTGHASAAPSWSPAWVNIPSTPACRPLGSPRGWKFTISPGARPKTYRSFPMAGIPSPARAGYGPWNGR